MTNKTLQIGPWIQNCHNFEGLVETVKIFDTRFNLNIKEKIKRIVVDEALKKEMLVYLENPEKIPLKILQGSSFTPRSSAKCNGIVQAVIDGQKINDDKKKEFTDDWTAINFIKWANALDLIKVVEDKTKLKIKQVHFTITELGLKLCQSISDNDKNDILMESFAKYPPIYRVLSLIENSSDGLTKFDIGKHLGYKNEKGYTSLNIHFLIDSLENKDKKTINKEITNFEGTSDKYARGICTWLLHLGLINKNKRCIKGIKISNYTINFYGKKLLNTIRGNSSNPQTIKRVTAGLLSSGANKSICTALRRRSVLEILKSKNELTITDIKDKLILEKNSIKEDESVIYNDINGFINVGINIVERDGRYTLKDKLDIEYFDMPKYTTISDEITTKLNNLYNKIDSSMYDQYYELVNLSYNNDGKKSILFEIKTMEYLLKCLNFDGIYLGGMNKPDGMIFFTYLDDTNIEKKVTILFDQKSYSKGFALSVTATDPMGRYIDQIKNKIQNKDNSHNWWDIDHCKESDEIIYCYVSSEFKGDVEKKIDDFSKLKSVNGCVITAENLLLLGDQFKKGNITTNQILELFRSNKEIIL